jgi:nitroreductase
MTETTDVRERLAFVLQRQSCPALDAPAPADEALALIFEAATRVPDHMRLRPYAFIVATGEGLDRLGALMQAAAIASGKPDDVVQRTRRMPQRAPMVVVVVATPRPHDLVPAFDQQLAAGCAVMAMQMAAQALGFGGVWRSGWLMYDRGLHSALGLADQDQIVGFLYLGTPRQPPPAVPKVPIEGMVRWL